MQSFDPKKEIVVQKFEKKRRSIIAVPDFKVDKEINIEPYKKPAKNNAEFQAPVASITKEAIRKQQNFGTVNVVDSAKSKNNVQKKTKVSGVKKRSVFSRAQRKVYYAAVTAAVLVVVSTVLMGANFKPAYEVFVNDQSVGIVTDKAMVEDTLNDVKSELAAVVSQEEPISEPTYAFKIVTTDSICEQEEIKTNILSTVDEVQEGFCIMVDGEIIAAFSDEVAANTVLEQLKAPYIDGNIESVGFDKDVSIKKEVASIGLFTNAQAALDKITGNMEQTMYTVQENDTFWDIAEKFDIPVETLQAMNPDVNETALKTGQQIKVQELKPLFSVCTVKLEEYETQVPCEVQKIEDASLLKGTIDVVEEGAAGVSYRKARVTYQNGVEISREVLEETVVSAPVTRVEKVGTKEPPSSQGSGSFIRPYLGTLTSRFGSRWGGTHTGMDLAGPVGAPIKASDNGRVVTSGWSGGYGNLVVIDHGNGYQTYYAHCSKLLVKVGDVVSQGDVIAKIGSTGNSTGPHVHFEVRKNGVPQNPQNYV